ncbi:MAG TPA: mandelate racemase/muconate lactonizing enzyme family protein, partial [Chloroflexota bacterium]|nr:mandelate racemase/muconate lactonizing enzyme family protein [Chloroflexota bacterium]
MRPSIAPRITNVRPILLRAPIIAPVRMAVGQLQARQAVLVLIDTDAGITGIGESWVNYPSWGPLERLATITHGLRPLLLGEPIDDPVRLWHKCVDALHRLALQWGAIGPIYQAISGVDLALWDLSGQIAGVPLWQLLGAPTQAQVPAYASGLGPDAVEAQATAAMAAGFRAVKLKVGFGRGADETNLAAIRSAIGDGTLFTDANQGWSLEQARSLRPALVAAQAAWMEEPFPADDDPAWQAAKEVFGLPLAGGENLYGVQFERWFEQGLLDIVQPDICKCGGLTAARRILAAAGKRGLRLAPHFFGSAVGLAATIHLFASLP